MKLIWIAAIAATAFAQETPTEREAAKTVLRQMSELELSLDVPTIVERLTVSNPDRDQVGGAGERADGQRADGGGGRHHAPSRDRV